MLLRAVGKGLAKVFSKSAEVLFLQSVKCVSSFLPSPADFPSLGIHGFTQSRYFTMQAITIV